MQATEVEAAEHAAVHAGCALGLATLLRGTAARAVVFFTRGMFRANQSLPCGWAIVVFLGQDGDSMPCACLVRRERRVLCARQRPQERIGTLIANMQTVFNFSKGEAPV